MQKTAVSRVLPITRAVPYYDRIVRVALRDLLFSHKERLSTDNQMDKIYMADQPSVLYIICFVGNLNVLRHCLADFIASYQRLSSGYQEQTERDDAERVAGAN